MKRLLTLFLLMYVGLSAMASETSVKNAEGVEIWYDFDSSIKIASVTYKGGSYDSYDGEYSGEVVIPSTVTYDGVEYSVTSIGNYAFRECSALTSITLPESLASIWDDAFYGCSGLTSITLPESVTEIGDDAFSRCFNLWIVYNKSSLSIKAGSGGNGYVAYHARIVTNGEEEGEVKIVGDYHFYVAGDKVELIGYTGNETSITLPSDYEGKNYNICTIAFWGCNALTSIAIPDGVTSIGDYAFWGCNALTSIAIPDGVTSIGDYAFYECEALTSITLSESLMSIGEGAFMYCSALTSITLPEGVTSIGDDAFWNCNNLWWIINKSDLTITAGSSDNGDVARYAKKVYTEGEVKTVGDYHFYVAGDKVELIGYTGNETSITLPSDYEGKNYSICNYAFYSCSALTSIAISDGVTSIGDFAFYCCSALTSITFSESLKSIGDRAFWSCDALTSITIPKGVTSIGDFAFWSCDNLCWIINKSDLTITAGSEDNGYVARYAKKVYTEGEVKTVGDYHFYVAGDKVKLIGYTGYKTSITLPSDYEGNSYDIAENAFYECEALRRITLPEGVTEIGAAAFYGCSGLLDISLPASLENIRMYSFYECSSLSSIKIPEGISLIEYCTFSNCTKLESITLPSTLSVIDDYAFQYCTNLHSIELPKYVSKIGKGSFRGCNGFTNIISLNTTPPMIGDKETFKDVDKTISVYVPKSSVDAYKNAEYWKDFTNIVGVYYVDVIAENGTVDGAGVYEENDEVTLTVTPNEGYKFVQWSDGVTDNSRTIVVVSNMTFTAEFELKEYTLTTEAENGTVEGADTYKHGDEVKLTATPAEGYKFVQWSDGVTDNPRTVVVVSDMTFTAEFELKEYTLTTEAENGTVEGAGTYKHGDEVTLTATPTEGYKFVQWSDGVTDNPRTVVVVSDMTFTAEFELKEYTLTTKAENGTVEGAGTYKHGDEATLTATPIVGYIFAKWSDGVTDNPRIVIVTSDMMLTAEFEKDDTPISDIQTSDVNVRLIGNNIVVEGADDYTVYSVSGQNLGKVESVERGVYIVVVNGKSYKVVAK